MSEYYTTQKGDKQEAWETQKALLVYYSVTEADRKGPHTAGGRLCQQAKVWVGGVRGDRPQHAERGGPTAVTLLRVMPQGWGHDSRFQALSQTVCEQWLLSRQPRA